MAMERIVKQAELARLGLPAVCDRVEVQVYMAELALLKIHYSRLSAASRIIFSNSEELLVRLPTNQVEVLYYGPMKVVAYGE